jgi:hypothetical protein
MLYKASKILRRTRAEEIVAFLEKEFGYDLYVRGGYNVIIMTRDFNSLKKLSDDIDKLMNNENSKRYSLRQPKNTKNQPKMANASVVRMLLGGFRKRWL